MAHFCINLPLIIKNMIINLFKSEILLGAMIAFMGAIIGGIIGHFSNRALLYEKENNEIKALIKALRSEIKSLKVILDTEFIPKINHQYNQLNYSYPLDTDYFVIYHSNLSKIGKITNDKLREVIISIYSTAKFFHDSLRTNNQTVEDIKQFQFNIKKELYDIDSNYREKVVEAEKDNVRQLEQSYKENLYPTLNKLIKLIEELGNIK